jgi:hypothetical protein
MSNEQGFRGVPGVPEGWELVSLRAPDNGEWIIGVDGEPFQSERSCGMVVPIIRKIEKPAKCRPFANAEEFKPHRDRWWKVKGADTVYPPGHYKDVGYNGSTWQQAFNDFVFDDGTPFGVKVEEW